jgi:hypothetical protein
MDNARMQQLAPPPPPPPVGLGSPVPAAFRGYHPRAVAVARAFDRPLRHAQLTGIVAGVLLTVIVAGVVDGDTPLLPAALWAAVPATLLGTAVGVLLVPRSVALAFATFSWLGHRELARFRQRTGSPPVRSAGVVRGWLATNPATPATALARIEMLAIVGETDAAAAELEVAPPPVTDLDRLEHVMLRQHVRYVATGDPGLEEVDALIRSLPPGSPEAREARVSRALAVTRARLGTERDDWAVPLVEAGQELGAERWVAVVQDSVLPLAFTILLVTVVVGLLVALVPPAWTLLGA